MSKNKKFIVNGIIVAVVIGALGTGVYFLKQPEEGSSLGEIYADDKITVFTASAEEFVGADVTNKYGSYSLLKNGNSWTIKGFESVGLNATMLDNLTYAFGNVKSTMRVEENPSDLAAFGLDSPSATVAIHTKDGGKTFYIGDKTPDGTSYYFNTNTSSDVYLMESFNADVAFLTARDYANLEGGITAEDITGIRIVSSKGTFNVEMNPDGPKDRYGLLSYWTITEPVHRSASNTDVSTFLTTPAAELESNVSAIIELNDEKLAETGLNNPEYTLEIEGKENASYSVSPSDGEYRYIVRSGQNYILRIDSEDVDFLDADVYTVSEKYLALVDISMLRSVEFKYGSRNTVFTAVDGGGENAAFYADGRELDSEKFRKFYQQIIAVDVSGEAENPVYENIVGTICYTLNSGETIELEFVPYDERNYAVFVNGKGEYTILKKTVNRLFDLYKDFI